jgi:hypothetical protein
MIVRYSGAGKELLNHIYAAIFIHEVAKPFPLGK